jgi:hypothetical protein
MLKRKIYFLTVIVSVALLFLSCSSMFKAMATAKITHDPDLPKEQTALVIFNSNIRVQQYNGIDVKDAWYPKGKDIIKVTLPAGSAAVTLNYSIYFTEGDRITEIKRNNLEMRFDFEAGKEYAVGAYGLRGESKGFLKGYNWTYGIGVWSKTSDVGSRDKAIKYWELGDL